MFGTTRLGSALATGARAVGVASIALLGTCHAIAAPDSAQTQSLQSPESFEAAVRDNSTSPVYVLITVVDDTTGQTKTGCTTANLLLGAIHMEYGLPYDQAAVASAEDMALANSRHVFHFSKADALNNVAFHYSPQDMEAAHQLIQPLSDEQLHKAFSQRGELQAMSWATRDARACALIERGLWVRVADMTGSLLLDR